MAEVLAEGYNVFDTAKSPSGTIKYLSAPADVIGLIKSGKLSEHILLVRGGTTTFLAPALSMGAIGVITMSGAPESRSCRSSTTTTAGWAWATPDRTSCRTGSC